MIEFTSPSLANTDPTYNFRVDGDVDGDNDGVDLSHFYANFGAIWSFDDSLYDTTTLVAFTSKRYDANNRLVDSISGNARSHLLLETELTYDFANRVVTKTVDGKETVYEYDRASQLVEESITGFGGSSKECDYDLAGNRDMDGYTLVDETVGLQEHVSANRYETAAGWSFEYDLEGQGQRAHWAISAG